ncbi:hypothetical protein TRAPUB_8813 [Trametes pubescens]|uniref:Uncharacterized protein n=1 Tax=Trametes pubescens TaxID=154538 RepID=A0A1M2W449_TRAPU|nr:hypothetical protein TRAPUB_8813 [Trametes pubescens]
MITVRPVQEGPAQTQAPVLPPEKQAELTTKSQITQAQLEEDLQKWYEDSICFSENLARCFGMTPKHYENLMFSGALKNCHSQRKPNTYNAWLHHLSQENSDEGLSVTELIDKYSDKYEAATEEQKQEWVKELKVD